MSGLVSVPNDKTIILIAVSFSTPVPILPRGHGWRSDAGRIPLDRLVAIRDCRKTNRTPDAHQSTHRQATSILLLGDAGGSNHCRHYIFKQDLQRLVNEIGVEIRMAHYPTYGSKFNPIERRFFSQVTRACQGVLFDRLATVVELMRQTATRTGLTTTVHGVKKIYETGRAATQEFRDNMPIKFDSVLPRWNYAAIPQA